MMTRTTALQLRGRPRQTLSHAFAVSRARAPSFRSTSRTTDLQVRWCPRWILSRRSAARKKEANGKSATSCTDDRLLAGPVVAREQQPSLSAELACHQRAWAESGFERRIWARSQGMPPMPVPHLWSKFHSDIRPPIKTLRQSKVSQLQKKKPELSVVVDGKRGRRPLQIGRAHV